MTKSELESKLEIKKIALNNMTKINTDIVDKNNILQSKIASLESNAGFWEDESKRKDREHRRLELLIIELSFKYVGM